MWTVENRAEDQGVTYTCNVSNPVSWAIGTFPVPGRIAYGKCTGCELSSGCILGCGFMSMCVYLCLCVLNSKCVCVFVCV